jgi:hypothetical protein
VAHASLVPCALKATAATCSMHVASFSRLAHYHHVEMN